MNQNEFEILNAQIASLKESIGSLIEHRETITDNTNEFYVNDMIALIEPIDASILAAIDGLANVTKNLPKS